ncbi:MAG: penicillin-binding protein 2 [Melioribacteraceae bacterium]|nr:penicillin-binding protein 2 [Melioribacteraceae bacterium]
MTETFFGSVVRQRIILFVIIGFSFVVSINLFKMQILENPTYEKKSEENSIKKIVRYAPRGVFYDRNGEVLVSNKPSFTLQITPSQYKTNLTSMLENVMQEDSGYIADVLNKYKGFASNRPIRIKRDIDFQTLAWYEENSENLSGVDYVIETQRDYSYGVIGAHIFGYTKEITSKELAQKKEFYDLGDYIGSKGLEKTYEEYLRGSKGYNLVLVDSRQRIISRYLSGKEDISPIKGKDLVLTLDLPTQQKAEELFLGKKGAVVAIEPSTGEIIAFTSSPSFDLNSFASVTSGSTWNDLVNDPDKPLFNRATMSIYPPGSTIKMLEALIGLEENIIDKDYSVNCQGGYRFGDRFFKCTHVHGTVDMERSIEKSCNTYYYKLMLEIGLEKWAEYMRKFGFGSKTEVDISEESAGLVPDTEYYNRVYGPRGWTRGFLVSLGIGQGELSATPIQLAQYVSLLANSGETYKPHFVKGYINDDGELVKFPFDKIKVDIKKENFEIVRKGMYDVVNESGTATWIKQQDVVIAGKTGTSQNPHGKDHALFVGFAPYDNPKIAVAVFVENVGFGSTHAAPIARDLIRSYLRLDKQKEEKIETNIAGINN